MAKETIKTMHERDISAERTECTERVCGEQHLFRRFIRHHDLRPVNHRSHHKREAMGACVEGIALLDELHGQGSGEIGAEKLLDHGARFGIADDGRFRMETNDLGKGCGVIRLHVVDDDEIQRSVGEKMV